MKRILVYLAVFLAAVVLAAAASAQTLTWHSDQLIRYTTYDAGSPSVAISGNNAVAVWKHSTNLHDQIYASYSTDKGKTWSTPVDVDYSTLNAQQPKVAIDGSNVVVVFSQYDGDEYRIYANYSADGGQTWGGAQLIEDNGVTTSSVRLNEKPASDAVRNAYEPQVAMSGSNVVVIWRQNYAGSDRIYANRSTNGGQTWGTVVRLDGRSHDAQEPRLAMSGNNVVAVWAQNDGTTNRIYSAYSANAGGTWAADVLIENMEDAGYNPSVAISGNNVVVVWLVWFNNPINCGWVYSNRAAFSGGVLTWVPTNTQRIDSNNTMDGSEPRVAISGDNVVAVWQQYENATGVYHLYTARSANAGSTWSANQLLVADNTVNGGNAQVAINGQKVIAVWQQEVGALNRIYARHSFDGGSSWKDPVLIEDNDKNAYTPALALSENDVVVVWTQFSDGTSGAGIQFSGDTLAVYSNYATFSGSTIIAALDGGGGGCFIATAAFGSPLAGQVEILRQFRDKYLLTNELGRKFVAWYYKNGPAAAAFIADKPLAKLAVQAALYPLVGFSFLLINGFMPFVMAGFALALIGMLFFRFRSRRLSVD